VNGAGLLGLLLALSASQTLVAYRVQHRPAAEMLSVAETALGTDGTVALDARTATLILNGSPEAVERTVALLSQLDRRLRSVVVTHEIRERSELERLSVRVDWKLVAGPIQVGTIPLPLNGIRLGVSAGRESRRVRSRSLLRLLEGGTGSIVTGDALPFVYPPFEDSAAVSFVPAETGFEARASITGDETVQLEIRPFSGRFEGGGALRYTGASTSIRITPGETVVIAEASSEESARSTDLGGHSRLDAQEERVLLVSVEIED
jgi:hypothetical protein